MSRGLGDVYKRQMSGLRALNEFVVMGIDTTIPFHIRLLGHPVFREGFFSTKFLEIYDIMNEEG